MTHCIISHYGNHSEWAWGSFNVTIAWIKTHATNLATHPIDAYTHIARMLCHHHAVVFILIEHRFSKHQVRNVHSHGKGVSFRMVTVRNIHPRGKRYSFRMDTGKENENEEKKEACPS